MKITTLCITGIACLVIPLNALAFDAACEPVIKATEASANAPTWQKIVTLTNNKDFKMEFRKINGQYYTLSGGEWKKQDDSFDEAVKSFAKELRSDVIKISQCKDEGSETVDGVDTTVMSYRLEMTGAPAVNSKVYIGKTDGLPYAESSAETQTRYSYKNVVAPKL